MLNFLSYLILSYLLPFVKKIDFFIHNDNSDKFHIFTKDSKKSLQDLLIVDQYKK